MVKFFVPGRPAPQGSKRSVGHGRFIEASKYLPAWRKAVTEFAIYETTMTSWDTIPGPARLIVSFYLERPSSISKRKRPFPIVPPDLDKLCRGVADALSDAGVWGDDSQVVELIATKHYADTSETGVMIEVTELNTPEHDSKLPIEILL